MRKQLLIIGNGMATGRLLDELLKRKAQKKFRLTVVGDEPYGNYNRIMLSSVLAKELGKEKVIQKDKAWFAQHDMSFICGVAALKIDREKKSVHLANGERLSYDHLVLATGSRPAEIPAGNQQLANIFSFRSLNDVEEINRAAGDCKQALVVGGGFLGLEAAYGLAKQGAQVSVVHRGPWLLNRQLDDVAARFLKETIEGFNIDSYVASEVESFIGDNSVSGAKLKSGKILDCDIAVIATGISPNKALAEESGIAYKRGICVDDVMSSSDESISALGECVEHRGETFGLVEPIWQMCCVLADKLCGDGDSCFVNKPVATKLKISGVNLLSAGNFITQKHHHELVFVDEKNKCYRKILLDKNKLVGTVLFGDISSGADYFELMDEDIDVSSILPQLIFGSAHFDMNLLRGDAFNHQPLSA